MQATLSHKGQIIGLEVSKRRYVFEKSAKSGRQDSTTMQKLPGSMPRLVHSKYKTPDSCKKAGVEK